jgi:thiol-disulfide isomerase/thioredoxin
MVIVEVLAGIIAVATALGFIWKATTGRVRTATGEAHDFATGEVTLLQFSTEVCAPCAATHTLLATLAAERKDVSHVDIDITNRPDLAQRFKLLQSPTTLVLDAGGNIRARIGGAPRTADVIAALDLATRIPVHA